MKGDEMMRKYDFEEWETLATMLVISVILAVTTLVFIGLVFDIAIFSMG